MWLQLLALSLSLVKATADGVAIQLLRPISGTTGEWGQKWEVDPGGAEALRAIRGPTAVVGIVGPYHGGKSYFLNRLVHALGGPQAGLKLGYTVRPETRGLWLAPHVLRLCGTRDADLGSSWYPLGNKAVATRCPDGSSGTNVVFMDTEGFHSPQVDEVSDAKIFAFTFSVSSELLYNSVKLIDQQQVEYLELLTRRSTLFGLRSYTTGTRIGSDGDLGSNLLGALLDPPRLSWIVQDFINEFDDFSGRTPREWLSRILANQPTSRFISPEGSETNMAALFKDVDCWTLPPPARTEEELRRLDTVSEDRLFSGYKRSVKGFSNRLVTRVEPKVRASTDGDLQRYFGGSDVVALLEFLVQMDGTTGDDVFKVPNVWQEYHTLQSHLVANDLVDDFDASIAASRGEAQRRRPDLPARDIAAGLAKALTVDERAITMISSRAMEAFSGSRAGEPPAPLGWVQVWTLNGARRLVGLLVSHTKASGTAVPVDMEQQLFSLLISSTGLCDDIHSSGQGLIQNSTVVIEVLPDFERACVAIKEELAREAAGWCGTTGQAALLAVEGYKDALRQDSSSILTVLEVEGKRMAIPINLRDAWIKVTDDPYSLNRWTTDNCKEVQTMIDSDSISELSLNLTAWAYEWSNSPVCVNTGDILDSAVSETLEWLDATMFYRRGRLLYESFAAAFAPLLSTWDLCLSKDVDPLVLQEFIFIGQRESMIAMDRFSFTEVPIFNTILFVFCHEGSKFTRYKNYDQVKTAFNVSQIKLEERISSIGAMPVFVGETRVSLIATWTRNLTKVNLFPRLAALWAEACRSDETRMSENLAARFVQRIRGEIQFPTDEETLAKLTTREGDGVRRDAKKGLAHCFDHSRELSNALENAIEESIHKATEELELGNLLAIRDIAGEPLTLLFMELQEESSEWYIWRKFRESAISRVVELIDDRAKSRGRAWEPQLTRKVSLMAVDEVCLPTAMEGNRSKAVSSLLPSLRTGQVLEAGLVECSGVSWFDIVQQWHCVGSRWGYSSNLVKGLAYDRVETNQIATIARAAFILGYSRSVFQVFRNPLRFQKSVDEGFQDVDVSFQHHPAHRSRNNYRSPVRSKNKWVRNETAERMIITSVNSWLSVYDVVGCVGFLFSTLMLLSILGNGFGAPWALTFFGKMGDWVAAGVFSIFRGVLSFGWSALINLGYGIIAFCLGHGSITDIIIFQSRPGCEGNNILYYMTLVPWILVVYVFPAWIARSHTEDEDSSSHYEEDNLGGFVERNSTLSPRGGNREWLHWR